MKKLLLVFWVVVSMVSIVAAEPQRSEATLPLREVILYSSGVGFFERAGAVEGRARAELRFRAEEINDLLKSMVVQDLGGGQITAVTYESRDPITKTLKSFALDLTGNPSLRDLLNQMRGERVAVHWPNLARGTVVGVESREEPLEEGKGKVEAFHLNLLADGAFLSIPLRQVQKIEVENEQLRTELAEALKVLASGHDTQKKTVSFAFDGEGKREVKVSYIAQAPVWKTSYRLVLDDKGAFLQGWAIVENTSDENWDNVTLSLVSGRPISFIMDLYQPLYAQRPVVQPELFTSLVPQTYQDAFLARLEETVSSFGASPAGAVDETRRDARVLKQEIAREMAPAQAASLRVRADKSIQEKGVAASAEGAVTGELFQYSISTPVSIARQKSAMLPIVTARVVTEKVSIYNQRVQAKYPLNGLRLTNNTGLHLMQGPITVFDGGAYAGDARIEDLAAAQDRLISYAIDLKTEVEPRQSSEPFTLVSARIRRGTLFATKRLSEQTSYLVRNRDQKKKLILIEHPVRSDWELETPQKGFERARDVYRFRVETAPDKTEKLIVRENKQIVEEVLITSVNPDAFGLFLRANNVSEAVKTALRKIAGFRDQLAEEQARRARREQRVQEISQEQARIRENMARLAQNSDLYRRYVTKFDEQETELEKIRKEIDSIKDRETALQRQLNEYISSLELE